MVMRCPQENAGHRVAPAKAHRREDLRHHPADGAGYVLSMTMARLDTLLAAPSVKSWSRICAMLDAWPDASSLEAAVAAVDSSVSRWPEKGMSMLSGWPLPNRAAPRAWAQAIKRGRVPPAWMLVRLLQYHAVPLTLADVTSILGSDQLTQITHLYLGMAHLKPPLLGMLADAADKLPALEAISLFGNRLPGDRMDDFLLQLGGQLTYLNLGSCRLGDEDIAAIARSENLMNLRGLDLSGCRFSPSGLDAFMETARLPDLIVLPLSPYGVGGRQTSHDHEHHAQKQGPRHLRRAAWAGQLSREKPAELKERCRTAKLRGHSRGGKHHLITLLLEHWDDVMPS